MIRATRIVGTVIAAPFVVYGIGAAFLVFGVIAVAFAPIGIAGRVARIW